MKEEDRDEYYCAYDEKTKEALLYYSGYIGTDSLIICTDKSVIEEIIRRAKKTTPVIKLSDPRARDLFEHENLPCFHVSYRDVV